MPLTGSAAGLARTLRLSPLVSLTIGEVMAGESMSGADVAIAGTVGCELAVLIQRLASRATARGWLAGVIAGCASGCADKLLRAGVRSSPDSATEALARARPGPEQR